MEAWKLEYLIYYYFFFFFEVCITAENTLMKTDTPVDVPTAVSMPI